MQKGQHVCLSIRSPAKPRVRDKRYFPQLVSKSRQRVVREQFGEEGVQVERFTTDYQHFCKCVV